MKILILLLLALLHISSSRQTTKRVYEPHPESTPINQTEHTFNQIINHFNYQISPKTFKQRYWAMNKYFNPRIGPVFLYICGEYTCRGIPQGRQWVVTMAQRMQGIVLVLEHRFYGRSMPFGNQSLQTANLRYLNSEQALRDLAYFTQQVQQSHLYGIKNNPWICVGGSYPGALSAWYRSKYPFLTVAGIASSAVINAIADFKQYDEQVYLSTAVSGDFCPKAINDSVNQVQQILGSPQGLNFKAKFQWGQALEDAEFLFFWIDSIIDKVQYGQTSQLCQQIKKMKSQQDLFNYFISIAKQNDPRDYGAYYLKNPQLYLDIDSSSRAWNWQCCSEFGWWQTPSDLHPMRSQQIKIDHYRSMCSQIFGEGTWSDIQSKNTQYGGANINAFNLFMTNGIEDPWKWASVFHSSQKTVYPRVANCTGCAHCVDLYTISKKDPIALKKIRNQQYLEISQILQTYWNSKQDLRSKIQIM